MAGYDGARHFSGRPAYAEDTSADAASGDVAPLINGMRLTERSLLEVRSLVESTVFATALESGEALKWTR